MDEVDGGILNIHLSDAEDHRERPRRTGQTEAQFQAVKRDYRAKIENGEIYRTIKLPLAPGANKQHVQEVLHAVEELYFFRRYQQALDFLRKVQSDGSAQAFDDDTRRLLQVYEERCRQKLNVSS